MMAIDDLLDRGRDARRRRDEAANELAVVLQALEGLAGVDMLDATQKRELARSLVRMFHGEEAVGEAERTFDAVVRREVPEDVPEVELPADDGEVWIVDLITLAGFASTNGEARRFIRGGAVRLGGEVVRDETLSLEPGDVEGHVLQVGKRRYARFVPAA